MLSIDPPDSLLIVALLVVADGMVTTNAALLAGTGAGALGLRRRGFWLGRLGRSLSGRPGGLGGLLPLGGGGSGPLSGHWGGGLVTSTATNARPAGSDGGVMGDEGRMGRHGGVLRWSLLGRGLLGHWGLLGWLLRRLLGRLLGRVGGALDARVECPTDAGVLGLLLGEEGEASGLLELSASRARESAGSGESAAESAACAELAADAADAVDGAAAGGVGGAAGVLVAEGPRGQVGGEAVKAVAGAEAHARTNPRDTKKSSKEDLNEHREKKKS